MKTPLTAREVCQLLRDIALGTRLISLASTVDSGILTVDADGWRLGLCTSNGALASCESCHSPDGRSASQEAWQSYGTDPMELLSTWELAQVSRLLNELAL
ncbi:DUF7693 family protein [Pseudomonas syringae]|uniref:DUF7693 family protein n=1 Tax=Pseudomonas syringae TaxID=317 RepID=UPI0009B0BA87